ncbi:hypothetical protein Tco_0351805 [Tanacetum coccineum]
MYPNREENAKSGPMLDDSTFDDLDADLAHSMYDMETKEAMNEGRQSNRTEELNLDADTEVIDEDKGSGEKGEVGTADPTTPPTTTTIFDDEEMILADTLVKMKDNKAKGVVFKNTEELVRPARLVLTLKPLPSIYLKDKGKDVLEEPELTNKMTRSDFDAAQVDRDAEVARQLEVELQAEVERERQREEQASMDYIANLYDEVQAITADHELAVRLTHEEQENYTVDDKMECLLKSKQNMGGYKHSQLKAKTFEEIQAMYERQKKKINDFKPMDSDDAVKDSEEFRCFKERIGDMEQRSIFYWIFRSDGSSRWIKTFSEMVTRFDRLDLWCYTINPGDKELINYYKGVDLVLW